MSSPWWSSATGFSLAQGDLLPDCLLPQFADPDPTESGDAGVEVDVLSQRLIVVTQSCDLENNKVDFVALCPVSTLAEFAEENPHYKRTKNWEQVRRGQIHALHLFDSPETPGEHASSLVVDFGHIVSLPIEYLSGHANALEKRWRLNSPFLEHFSQAFARFFMRVGLPAGIKPFV